MDETAFLFPGQGSQTAGMGRWLSARPAASAVFDRAEQEGFDARMVCCEAPDDVLARTEFTQPALLTVSVATLEVLRDHGVAFQATAGHSLGEYAALVAAGALSFDAALRLVRRRGELMSDAGQGQDVGMVAVIGIGADVLEAVCEEATTDDEFVAIANHNSPEQLVLSGHLAALRRAGEMAQAAGAKRVIPLRVSSAFHSPLMENVEEEMQRLMQEETFSDPQVRFYANVSGRLAEDAATVRALLARQVTSPVRWTEALRRMSDDGVRHFVEVGPGKVLVGLVRRTVPGARLYTTDTEAALMEVVGVLAGR